MSFKSGFVAIVGNPNVGKSSLFNSILDYNLSIVTNKSQTTRDNIKGIITSKYFQIILSDTPGHIESSYLLHDKMNKNILDHVNKIDDKNTIDILVLKEKISLGFSEDVNLASQKERILSKIESINKQIFNLNNKLNNKAYVKNAPKEIVQNDKKLTKELTIEEEKLRSIVASIN